MAVVVAQLLEQFIMIQEVHSSNLVIGKLLFHGLAFNHLREKNKIKRSGMVH